MMSNSSTKQSKVDSDAALSLEKYRVIVNEDSIERKEDLKVEHLYSYKNTTQLRWFKGSSDRGIRGERAA